ncbi:F0F1 ATP synthase subunit delta [Candidatus Omnitrophota bacterium]
MPWVQIAILLIFASIGLIFFLRHILTRHYSNVTNRLDELTKGYANKQAELDKRFRQAKQEYQDTIIKAKKNASELREKVLQEANGEKERILKEAHQRSEDMVEHAEKTCEFLKKEIERKIEEGALSRACGLLQDSLPDSFRQELHGLWMKESSKAEFQIGRLNLPKDIKEAKVVSAFPLTQQLREDFHGKLKNKLGGSVGLKEEVDSGLVVGFIITMGSVVIDASLRYRIQTAAKNT